MDILEKYSNEDINSVEEYIGYVLDNQGIEQVMAVLRRAQDCKLYWERYNKDREVENNKMNSNKFNIQEKNLFNILLNAFSIPITKKLDEEEEENLRAQSKEHIKILDIVSYDKDIKEEIANAYENIYYNENDILSRVKTFESIKAACSTLKEYENFEAIYKAISDLIMKMNTNDFIITFSNVSTKSFFKNPYLKDAIVNKIKNMNAQELMFTLIATQDGMDGMVPEIQIAKVNRCKELDNTAVSILANALSLSVLPEKYLDNSNVDKVVLLFRDLRSNKKFEVYEKLTENEFVRLFTMHYNVYKYFDKELMASEITDRKLKALSKESLVFLIELFYDSYNNYLLYKDNKRFNTICTIRMGGQWSKIIEEGKRRGLISQDNDKMYDENSIIDVQDMINEYKKINLSYFFPVKYPIVKLPNKEIEDNINENDDEFEFKKMKALNYANVENDLMYLYKIYGKVMKVMELNKVQVIQEVNRWNSNLKKDSQKDLNLYQKFMVCHLRKQILSLPDLLAGLFQVDEESKNGILYDAIKLKTDVIQSHMLDKEYDDNQAR